MTRVNNDRIGSDQVCSTDTGWYLFVVGHYIWRYWPVLGDAGSVKVGSAWFLVAKGQYRPFMPEKVVGCYRCVTDR